MPEQTLIDGEVNCYGYRTALVGDVFLTLPGALTRELEAQLAAQTGNPEMNHAVYMVDQGDGHGATYIRFSDHITYFGRTLVEMPH